MGLSNTSQYGWTETADLLPGRAHKTRSVHTGSVHTGSVHTGSVHTGSVHTGSMHTRFVHTGSVHAGSVHTGSVHHRVCAHWVCGHRVCASVAERAAYAWQQPAGDTAETAVTRQLLQATKTHSSHYDKLVKTYSTSFQQKLDVICKEIRGVIF